jgi:hypothetical protein
VLLRAAVPTRGMWETDVTAGASDKALALYMRDNFLDMGRLPSPPDGVPNPYDPSNPGATAYHYQCADIKVDAQQQGSGVAKLLPDRSRGRDTAHFPCHLRSTKGQ